MTLTLLLALTLALQTAAPVSAKPAGGSNSPNAKACQKGGYATLATSEDPHTAFPTEEACVSYAAKGGILTSFTPRPLSLGCSTVAAASTSLWGSSGWSGYPFFAGERLTFSASEPVGDVTGIDIVVDEVVVDSATGFTTNLTYDIPADGSYTVVFRTVPVFAGGALLDIGCFRP